MKSREIEPEAAPEIHKPMHIGKAVGIGIGAIIGWMLLLLATSVVLVLLSGK